MGGGNARSLSRLNVRRIESWLKTGEGPVKKLSDGGGLALVRLPSGTATWQLKYRIKEGDKLKERTYSIGPLDRVRLAEARKEREQAKAAAQAGHRSSARRVVSTEPQRSHRVGNSLVS